MTSEQLIENYSPSGDMITAIICCILMLIIAKTIYFSGERGFLYLKRALNYVLIGAISNIAFYTAIDDYKANNLVLYIFRYIFHISFMICLYYYILYVKRMLEVKGSVVNVVTYVTRILFVVCIILDLMSPVTSLGFHYSFNEWHDHIISPYNFFYVYAILVLFVMLVFYANRLILFVRGCLIVTETLGVTIMLYQSVLKINTFTSFTFLMPLVVVMLLLHSKPFDDKTGSLGANSFDSFIGQMAKKGISVDYMVLKLDIGMLEGLPSELGKVLNAFWRNDFSDAILFEPVSNLFVLAIPYKTKNGNTEEKIRELFGAKFNKYYSQFQMPYKMIGLIGIDFVHTSSDLIGIIGYLFARIGDNSFEIINEERRNELRLINTIRENLADIEKKNDLSDERVLVYCQPIRNMKTGGFDTAEALMRLSIPDNGMIMPGMFITLAEQYNKIHSLTKIMLNKVCRKIKEMEEEGYAFERISINFAASEIKAESFCDEILGIIKSYDISPSKIGIELTETQSESDFQIVKKRIKSLKDAGMTLYLDDVGTGYSNLDRIVKYDVDVVKFDRFFLMEAEKSAKIIKMLSHLSQAFRDLDYKLLYEGVETDSHEKICVNCDADYIQGFKYSKPVPIAELKNFFVKRDDDSDIKELESVNINGIDKRDFSYGEIIDQYGILISMSKLYYSMHIIDLINNTAKPYNPTEDNNVIDVVNSTMGADEMMRQIMRMCTTEEYVDAAIEFTDLTTIADRMINKRIYSAEYIGNTIGWYEASFLTIEADNTGRPTKVLFTTRSIDESKKREEKLIYKSTTDELTGFYNRRAYENKINELKESGLSDDFVYLSLDVDGLKYVNDSIGHEAGDELIIGACKCINESMKSHGDLYRTGGDEFIALIKASDDEIDRIERDIVDISGEWRGKLVKSLSISYGIVKRKDVPDLSLHDIAVLADKKMYEAKSAYYRKKGMDRRGQKDAHVALHALYADILKINLTTDSYQRVNVDEDDIGASSSLSKWLRDYGIIDKIHPDDLPEYNEKTNIDYMKSYFKDNKKSLFIQYRKKLNGIYKKGLMEIIFADDYSDNNQTLFLYIRYVDGE